MEIVVVAVQWGYCKLFKNGKNEELLHLKWFHSSHHIAEL